MKGQNFLINGRIADWIVERADIKSEDIILEIGSGKGILTKRLLKKARVIAIEKDKELCKYLEAVFENYIKAEKLKLLCKDALKINFPYFNKVVSNIPYYISSPLIFKILKYDFSVAILMLQKEFGERLCAMKGSKKYGRLSVMMRFYGDARIIKYVKKENFRPVPEVDSCIVEIKKDERFCGEPEKIEEIVRKIFSQRRKKIKNILGDVPHGDKRAEELTNEEICDIVMHYARLFN